MNSIYEIRRNNALLLVNFIGNKALFAERIERTPTQVSRVLGSNPTRNIGERLARHIEHCFCLPKFWLDKPQDCKGKVNQHINTLNQEKYERLYEALCELYQATISRNISEPTYNLILKTIENHRSLQQ